MTSFIAVLQLLDQEIDALMRMAKMQTVYPLPKANHARNDTLRKKIERAEDGYWILRQLNLPNLTARSLNGDEVRSTTANRNPGVY
jgi:hypothetical protein